MGLRGKKKAGAFYAKLRRLKQSSPMPPVLDKRKNRPHNKINSASSGVRGTKTFSIAVMATMSAGKSTLLNALIGERLLPTQCTACTAGVFSVVDNDEAGVFRVRGVNGAGNYTRWDLATADRLSAMNDGRFPRVEIEGDLRRISNFQGHKVVFIDTPGPNNSCDKTHAEIMRGVLESNSFSAVIVVLNAASLHTTDEYALVAEIGRFVKKHKDTTSVLFVLNRVDALFHGGECTRPLSDILIGARKFLSERCGFENPVVIPTWASLALDCRQLLNVPGFVGSLDEDAEDDLWLAVRKVHTHRMELQQEINRICDEVHLSVRTIKPTAVIDVVLPKTNVKMPIDALIEADTLSGVPAVESWAEHQLRRFVSRKSELQSPGKKISRKKNKNKTRKRRKRR